MKSELSRADVMFLLNRLEDRRLYVLGKDWAKEPREYEIKQIENVGKKLATALNTGILNGGML